jgi:hypothetical protein
MSTEVGIDPGWREGDTVPRRRDEMGVTVGESRDASTEAIATPVADPVA